MVGNLRELIEPFTIHPTILHMKRLPLHPLVIVRDDGGHLSLLKHNFRNPYLPNVKIKTQTYVLRGLIYLVRALTFLFRTPGGVVGFPPWHPS